jgi:hypothetical protein
MSNDFWHGFLMGVGLVFLVFVVARMMTRRRKGGGSASGPGQGH